MFSMKSFAKKMYSKNGSDQRIIDEFFHCLEACKLNRWLKQNDSLELFFRRRSVFKLSNKSWSFVQSAYLFGMNALFFSFSDHRTIKTRCLPLFSFLKMYFHVSIPHKKSRKCLKTEFMHGNYVKLNLCANIHIFQDYQR